MIVCMKLLVSGGKGFWSYDYSFLPPFLTPLQRIEDLGLKKEIGIFAMLPLTSYLKVLLNPKILGKKA